MKIFKTPNELFKAYIEKGTSPAVACEQVRLMIQSICKSSPIPQHITLMNEWTERGEEKK